MTMKKSKAKPAMDEANFEDDIATMIYTTSVFRDLLSDETSRLQQAKIDISNNGCSIELPQAHYDPQKHAHLHRLKLASDNFLSALSGHY
jgi:hypothetical protein